MREYLFDTIELLSDKNSFKLGVDTKRNLWLLLHFKTLKIRNHKLFYQINNGVWQRKGTKHPIRRMIKKHQNTSDFLEYLHNKSYDIKTLEIEFENDWRIKQIPYHEFIFYTNSISERNILINKLFRISAQGPIDISTLEINFTYYFESSTNLKKLDFSDLPNPDEFWSEEKLDNWKSQVRKIERDKQKDEEDKNTFSMPSEFVPLKFKQLKDGYPF